MSSSPTDNPPGPPRVIIIISSSDDEEMAVSTTREARVRGWQPRSNSTGDFIVISSEEEVRLSSSPPRRRSSSSTHRHRHHYLHRHEHYPSRSNHHKCRRHHHSRSPSSQRRTKRRPHSRDHGHSHRDPIVLSSFHDRHGEFTSHPRRPRQDLTYYDNATSCSPRTSLSPTRPSPHQSLPHHSHSSAGPAHYSHSPPRCSHNDPGSPLTHHSSSLSSSYRLDDHRKKFFSETSHSGSVLGKHSHESLNDAASAKRQRLSPSHNRQLNGFSSRVTSHEHNRRDDIWSQEQERHRNGYHQLPPGISSHTTDGRVPVKLECISPPPMSIKQECADRGNHTPPPLPKASSPYCLIPPTSQSRLFTKDRRRGSLTLSLKKRRKASSNGTEDIRCTSDSEIMRGSMMHNKERQRRNCLPDDESARRRIIEWRSEMTGDDSMVKGCDESRRQRSANEVAQRRKSCGELKQKGTKSSEMKEGYAIRATSDNTGRRSGWSIPRDRGESGGTRKEWFPVNPRDSTPEMSPNKRQRRSRLPSKGHTSGDGRRQQTLDGYLHTGDTTPPLGKTAPTPRVEHNVVDEWPPLVHNERDTTPPLPDKMNTPTECDHSVTCTTTALPRAQTPSSSAATLCSATSPPPANHRTCTPPLVVGQPPLSLAHRQFSSSHVHTSTYPACSTPTSSTEIAAMPAEKEATAISHQQSPVSCVRRPPCIAPHTSASPVAVSARKRVLQVAPSEASARRQAIQVTSTPQPTSLLPSWSDGEEEMESEAHDVPANSVWLMPGKCMSGLEGNTLTAHPAAMCTWNYVDVYMNDGDDAKFVNTLEDIITTGHAIPEGHVHKTLRKILHISDCSLLLRLHSILDVDANIRATPALNTRTLCELMEECCRTLHTGTSSSTHNITSSQHSAHVVLLYLVTQLETDWAKHRDNPSTALLERTLSLTTQWRRVTKIVDLILELLLHPKQQLPPLPDLPPVLAALLSMCVTISHEGDHDDGVTRLARELSSQLSKLPSVKLKRDFLLLIPCNLLRERTISIHLQSEFNLSAPSPSLPSEHVTLDLISTCHLHRLPYRCDGSSHNLQFFLFLLYLLLHSHCSRLLGLTPNTTSSPNKLPSELALDLQPLSKQIRRLHQRLSEDDSILLELTSPHCWFYLQLLESMFIWDH